MVQTALLEPDFLLVGQVGGDGGIGDAQFFDIDFADDLADLPEHLLAANRAKAKTHVHQAQHVEVVEAFDPVAILVQLAGGIDPAHYGAHGTAGDTGDVIAASFDFLDHPDMGVATGPARAQYQGNTFLHGRCPSLSRRPQCTY